MKKLFTLLVLTLVAATGCKSQSTSAQAKKLAQSGVTYEYKASTRGTLMEISITQKEIAATKGRPGEDTAAPLKVTPEKGWNTLLEETAKLNLNGLETLAVPSKKHQFDGALAASLKIMADGKTYTTPTFDHGNPPAEIKALVEKIIELSELEKQ